MNKEEKKAKGEDELNVGFDDWLGGLESKEQPEACSIDDPDCEACGS